MPRFFIATLPQLTPRPLHAGATIELAKTFVRHLHVLRLQAGDTVTLFDGTGGDISGHARRDRQAPCGRDARPARSARTETPYAVTLAQGIAGGDKMDWLLEKAIELGVRRGRALTTVRSVVRLSGERAQRRAEHWRALARAACEQCGRNRIPEIDAPSISLDGSRNAVQRGEMRVRVPVRVSVSAPLACGDRITQRQ